MSELDSAFLSGVGVIGFFSACPFEDGGGSGGGGGGGAGAGAMLWFLLTGRSCRLLILLTLRRRLLLKLQ